MDSTKIASGDPSVGDAIFTDTMASVFSDPSSLVGMMLIEVEV
jgi:hypothetical protein